jgi:hypothetical protein
MYISKQNITRHLSFSLYIRIRMACLMLTDIIFFCTSILSRFRIAFANTYVRVALVGCILQTCKFPLISEHALCFQKKRNLQMSRQLILSVSETIYQCENQILYPLRSRGRLQESFLPPPSIHHPTENTESGMQPESESNGTQVLSFQSRRR